MQSVEEMAHFSSIFRIANTEPAFNHFMLKLDIYSTLKALREGQSGYGGLYSSFITVLSIL